MSKKRVASNASWIIGCRIVQSFLNLIVGMLSARYLGPADYGLINYAASIAGFVTPLMRLGLNTTLVQEITSDETREGETLGTALCLNIPSGILSIIAVIGFVFFANGGETNTIVVCAIYSVSLLFQAAEMITYWYQAKLLSKYPSIAMVIGYISVSCYKIYLLITSKSVYWFAASNAIDHSVICIILLVTYFVIGKQKLSFSLMRAKKMLAKSKYYIVSGVMITVFQQTDKLMLKNMLNDEFTGYYSAAVTCAGIFGFVYAAVIDSARPVIFRSKAVSCEQYENGIISLYSAIFYASLFQCILTTIFAKPIIMILYGNEFLPAVTVLRVVVWFVTYSYFGTIRNIWILGEEKHSIVMWIDIIGAFLNILLNIVMITKWGEIGAAIASVLTQFLINFLLGFILTPLRRNNTLMLRGMNPKYAFFLVKNILLKNKRGRA